MMKNFSKNKGFTIIELMIALFILLIGVIGIYAAFSVLLISSSNIEDRLVAAYLAQEGIEIIRNIRDNNWLLRDFVLSNSEEEGEREWKWNQNILAFCQEGCGVDYRTSGFELVPFFPPDNYLRIDDKNFFSYDENGKLTKYKRKIFVQEITPYTMKVIAQVFWDEKPSILNPLGMPGKIEVEEIFYDWY